MNPVMDKVLNNKYCGGCPIFDRKVEVKEHEARIKARNRSLEANRKTCLEDHQGSIHKRVASRRPRLRWKCLLLHLRARRRYSLTYYMNEALFRSKIVEKEKFFEELGKHGFYLIDMIKCPFKNSDLCGVKGN